MNTAFHVFFAAVPRSKMVDERLAVNFAGHFQGADYAYVADTT